LTGFLSLFDPLVALEQKERKVKKGEKRSKRGKQRSRKRQITF
jgi:hypothetical protein